MADGDAEKAFFEAQVMNAENVDYKTTAGEQRADSSDSDDYDPSEPMKEQYCAPADSKQDFPFPVGSSAPDTRKQDSLPTDFPPGHPASDTYPSQPPSRPDSGASTSAPSSNPPVQPKARTIGGFVVDDDEDEDDTGDAEYEPPAALGGVQDMASISADIPQRAASQSAKESVSTPHVSLPQAAPEKDSSKNVSNSSSHSPSHLGSSAQNDNPSNPSSLPDPQTQAAMLPIESPVPTPPITAPPRTRLPHDRVGILEDRIQEDPRGDTDAWLELISEHRNRNKIESAREVYERLFKVFPSAVSVYPIIPVIKQILTFDTG